MLRIEPVKHLAIRLGTTPANLDRVISNCAQYYEEFTLIDPEKPNKNRDVLSVNGDLRELQERLYRRILLPKLRPSPYSHGGIKGRHILTNAGVHAGSNYIFTTDISSFYPSISFRRVYSLFNETFKCSPNVSRICTQLCTYKHHLALGLVTSPILADYIALPIDRRIAGMADKLKLRYSRFVDDISISGDFDLDHATSAVPETVVTIFNSYGFQINPGKHLFGRISDGNSITQVRLKGQHFDITREYAAKILGQLEFAAALAKGERLPGLYYTESQIRAKIGFIKWVNPGRCAELMRKFRAIPWDVVRMKARELGLIAAKVRLVPKSEESAPQPNLYAVE